MDITPTHSAIPSALVGPVHEQELALRHEEIKLKGEQTQHNLEYANKALAAQLEDRERERAFTYKDRNGARIFIGLIVFILALFLSIALFLNKDQIAMEIIKIIGPLFAGGFGGYAFGRQQARTSGNGTKHETSPAS